FPQMTGQPLGAIDEAMAAAGAAESHEQVGEVSLSIIVDRLVDELERVREEPPHFRGFGKIGDDRSVVPRQFRVAVLSAWIGERAAIEHETSAVALLVGRHAAVI